MHQKNALGQKKISNFMHQFKSGKIEKLPKWHFWKNIHNLSKGPPNPGFMQEKVQKGDFLKKDSRELFFFLVLGSYESLEGLER